MKFPELITLLKSKCILNKDVNYEANLNKYGGEMFYKFYAYNMPYCVTIRFVGDEKEVTFVQINNDITNETFEITGDVHCSDFDTI